MYLFCECGKKCYTKREAQETLNSFKRPVNIFTHHGVKVHAENKWFKKKPLRIYQCKLCNWWHITSQIKNGEKKIDRLIKE